VSKAVSTYSNPINFVVEF